VPADAGDDLALRMLADQAHGPPPSKADTRQEQPFMPECVDVALWERGVARIDARPDIAHAQTERSAIEPDHPGADQADPLDDERMANLHGIPAVGCYPSGQSPLQTSTAGPVMKTWLSRSDQCSRRSPPGRWAVICRWQQHVDRRSAGELRGDALAREDRLAHVDAHLADLAGIDLHLQREHAAAGLDLQHRLLHDAVIVDILGQAADAVAAHLGFAAVR